MKERAKFVLEWEKRWNDGEGAVNMSELCRVFGVSRQTGYKWVRRYRDAGRDLRAVEELSRRPRHNPREVVEEIQDLVVAARKKYPHWGPRKLRSWLVERYPEVAVPSASCMGEILRRRGMTRPRRRQRRRAVVLGQPFAPVMPPIQRGASISKGSFGWVMGSGVT